MDHGEKFDYMEILDDCFQILLHQHMVATFQWIMITSLFKGSLDELAKIKILAFLEFKVQFLERKNKK